MLSALLSLVFASPAAEAGCTSGRCAPVEGVETPAAADSGAVASSLALRPGAHLRTATFALG